MDPARILILEGLATISGGQQVLIDLLPTFQGIGEAHVLLPDEGPLAEALHARGVPCYFAPMGDYTLVRKTATDVANYALRLPWLVWLTWRILRRHHIDLLYANSARTFVWGTFAAVLARKPIIWHHHNLLADPKTLALLGRIGQLPSVHRIICASEGAQQQFLHLIAKTTVVPNGIDTQHYRPDPAGRARVRQELGIPLHANVVGIVGDLIPLKGQHTLLEAAPAAPKDTYFLIVGGSRPGDPESQAYAANLRSIAGETIRFTGRRADLPDILNALDLLVIASERETGPLVLLEALACGTAVLSTPVGHAPLLLPPGALFPIGDAEALAEQLRSWLTTPQKLQNAKATTREIALKGGSLEQMRTRVAEELRTALERRG